MAKFFKTNEEVTEFISNKFRELELNSYGLTLKIMSTNKAKEILKLTKASQSTQFLIQQEDVIQVQVYEAAFERLSEEAKHLLTEMMFSNISFDLDKDKMEIDTNPFNQIFRMRQKYGNVIVDHMELASLVMSQIAEEEQAAKEALKEAKKNKKHEQI
jgi:hypothetical protein